MRALVAGGSLGGLFAAHLMMKLGWEVDVFERVGDDLAARGAGIGTHAELLAVLGRLGIELDERLGIRAGDRVCVDPAGRELYRCPWAHTMSAWANVYRPLKDRFPRERYHFNKSLVSFSQAGNEIQVRFEDDTTAKADLLIGADGLRSVVRGQLFPGLEPAYAGYVAWRSIVDENAISAATRRWLASEYWFVLPPGEMMLAYQVPSKDPVAEPGRRDWNYVWYRPVTDAQLRDISTDASGRHHALGIPPPLLRADVVARIKDDARRLLAPQLAEIVERSQPFFQAIYDVESPRLASGRTLLLGDAAFVARPHVGMGVTKAALDAACLSDLLENETLENALQKYSHLRGEFGRRCVARARRLGAYIEARSRPQRAWTANELDQRPERVLNEVARALADIPELALED